MRSFSAWMVSIAIVFGALQAASAPAQPREVELTYLARVPKIPDGVKEAHVWIPLAKSRVEQQILEREVSSPVPYTIEKDPEYGNDILHLTLKPSQAQPVEISIGYRALLLGEQGPDEKAPGDMRRYLEPDQLVVIDDRIRAMAKQAVAGKETVTEKARGIYDFVIGHMAYDKTTPGYGQGNTLRACEIAKGNCTDFHSLFISMARAERIPSRFKIGLVVPPDASAGKIAGYHCWAEFYDGNRWVPVDASEAWKKREQTDYFFGGRDPRRFLVSVGRDIQLGPEAKGGPVNIMLYPYVEADGVPVAGVETEFQFREVGA